MARSRYLAPVWAIHLLSLASIAADVLGAQDLSSLRGDVASLHQSQDASVQVGIPSLQLRKPLLVDNVEHDLSAYRLSRDILRTRWSESWHEDLPCSKPAFSGFVPKTGTASQSPTLKLRGNSELYIGEEFPVYSGCNVRSLPLS